MSLFLSGRIGVRFLRSKKSHGAISAIAAVSVAGVAIATAAVVCVLSVFNGFREVLSARLDTLSPDVIVTPAQGKTIRDADSLASVLSKVNGVEIAMPSVTDKALALYGIHEMPVTIKGIDPSIYSKITCLDSILMPGSGKVAARPEIPEFEYYEDMEEYMQTAPTPKGIASIGAAVRLGNVPMGDNVLIFAPRRDGHINPANPATSFVVDSITVAGIYEAQQSDYDQDMILIPVELARELLQYDTEATAIEIKVSNGTSPQHLAQKLSNQLGPDLSVKDRIAQQDINFRMVNIEKWVSFLLLFFILIIASFNIITTLSMLVLEKRNSMKVLSTLGMGSGRIAGIFRWESTWVSITGAVIGLALGLTLCFLQQKFGFIRLNGNSDTLIMQTYPVKVIWKDIIIILIPITLISLLTAFITGRFARSRVRH